MDSVSVIVTCYNHEQYIEECLESIFLQEYSNIQVYVYNDGSTDASETKINNMMALSPFPIKYVYHENMGVVKTRNRALDEVAGDFILFLDSDDKIEKNYICELVATAQQNKADIVYCGMKKLQTNDLFLEAPSFDLNRLLEGNYIHSASLIRKKVISNVRYDLILNHDKLEDYDFFLNLIINRQAKAVANLNTYL
ncbi:glycosyltransferase family 2 protein, partial [Streptococcus pluranimalium]|uniref:glycosyltransferase family 2 protein n=1 Tax=Streptococcus pluranimalium TaxID=82348 RepID=UPI003BF7D0E7